MGELFEQYDIDDLAEMSDLPVSMDIATAFLLLQWKAKAGIPEAAFEGIVNIIKKRFGVHIASFDIIVSVSALSFNCFLRAQCIYKSNYFNFSL